MLATLSGACLGWALFTGGASSTPPERNSVENATKSLYRWSGNPITLKYAIEPDFCEALHPLLWETSEPPNPFRAGRQNYTVCKRLHRMVHDAFAVWAAGNPELHFVDVTQRCADERLWKPVADDHCSESVYCIDAENFTDWKVESTQLELQTPPVGAIICSQRTCFECDRADVMVGGFTQKNRRLGDQHSYGRVYRLEMTDERPYGSNGLPVEGKTVKKAFLEINMDDEWKAVETDGEGYANVSLPNCWRVDSDVCDWFAVGDANATFDGVTIVF